MRTIYTDVFWVSSSIFLPIAHLQPVCLVLTQDAAGSKWLCCLAPSPLRVLPERALVNTPDFVPLQNENFLKYWKKDLGAGNFCTVSASQQIPVWFSSLSSGGELDLQPYSLGSGWFCVLSEIVGLIFLGSLACFLCGLSQCVVFEKSHMFCCVNLRWSLWFQ